MSARGRAYAFLVATGVAFGVWYTLDNYVFDPAVSAAEPGTPVPGAMENIVPVETAQAVVKPISSYISSTANLRALHDVVIASQADGIVTEVLVEEGARVAMGEVLCRLDDRELKGSLGVTGKQLEQARLQFKKAQIQERKAAVQVKNATAELKRHETAFAQGLVSEEDVATLRYAVEELQHDRQIATSDAEELQHRVEELQGQIEQVKLEIERTHIRAPFAGYIAERMAELGQTIRNTDQLYRLASFSTVFADVHLPEQAANQVRAGLAATVALQSGGGGEMTGRVLRVSSVVDDATGTVKVTTEFQPSSRAFRPGAFVVVRIKSDTRADAVLIPKRAVMTEDGGSSVFVIDGNIAERRSVVLGYETDRDVEIRSGVVGNERIVVAGQGNLDNGTEVRTVEAEGT